MCQESLADDTHECGSIDVLSLTSSVLVEVSWRLRSKPWLDCRKLREVEMECDGGALDLARSLLHRSPSAVGISAGSL
jgi:hypothetical protein